MLLDSTVLIDALRVRPAGRRIAQFKMRNVEPWTCAISAEEIRRGLHPGEEVVARRLFHGLRMAQPGLQQGRQAGVWRRNFVRRGVTLYQADCLIAAAALGIGASLATANIDDFPMPELMLEHWPVGV